MMATMEKAPDERAMLSAVATRDARMDGRFVYGVITTGIYCHPSCPSRPARPENLRFFTDAAAASAAGFRACRRCRADAPALSSRLHTIARFIQAEADEVLDLKTLASLAELSPARFQRAFKTEFGSSPLAFQQAFRAERFKTALREGSSVTAAGHGAGYGSPSRAHLHAKRSLGMMPSTFRSGGRGEHIHFAIRQTSLGLMIMAASSQGLCLVEFGDTEEALYQQLEASFPNAELLPSPQRAKPALEAWTLALEAHLRGWGPRPDLPLDLRGTAFQVSVWRFLLTIPCGETISYTALAAGIDRPSAVRAAATACAANKIAVLVPCHRVLRGDGQLGGYRWGLARKQALLHSEKAHS
ncbi:MAG: cysteine methyltransferase [unclassified Hahellaceae]|nr:cysteine methyltransferase [Hahellaceae bacterium]|tara:strand:- start:22673 stop:23743 length:1071 start_codon:yes stop_codon:yes gene_type:complete